MITDKAADFINSELDKLLSYTVCVFFNLNSLNCRP